VHSEYCPIWTVFQHWHALKHISQLLGSSFTRKAFLELKTRKFWKEREKNLSLYKRILLNHFMWTSYKIVRFEVFTAVTVKSEASWVVGPSRSCENGHSRGLCHFHLESRKNPRAKSSVSSWLAIKLASAKAALRSRILSTLKMEVTYSSKTLVLTRPTWRHIGGDGTLQVINLFSHNFFYCETELSCIRGCFAVGRVE
jgi:hypothetical protein